MAIALEGLRTVVYPSPDLDAAKRWWSGLLGQDPYFDEPFYVGFDVGGYELGLQPDDEAGQQGLGGAVPYWGVADAAAAHARLVSLGAVSLGPVQEVGEGIRVAVLQDPFGNALGIIENPHFAVR
jgi:predicted enzyme related to lactoylglutathione lyase